MVQKEHFFGKIIAQKRCKYHCFCFLWLVAMESVVFTVFRACVFTKHCKYQSISDMLCCQSAANSGVLATLAFLVVAKTS